MSQIFDNIGELFTADPQTGILTDAAVVTDGDRIEWIGPSSEAPAADIRYDLGGKAMLPGFVDSHSHIVFRHDRAAEFAARMAGQPYTGGGIRTTVADVNDATESELERTAQRIVGEMTRTGTTTVEIKSGYGLNPETELKQLSIAARHTGEVTFLGAHTVPSGRDSDDYTHEVAGSMLSVCAPQAKWVDVFCEKGAFNGDQTRHVLEAGVKAGLLPRLHANQLSHGPGVQIAVEFDAASADHCTHLDTDDVDALANSNTVATLLPGAEFSTRNPYPDARGLIDAGATVALATDCNPGSSYTSSMAFCIALAVREMHLTPHEAVTAATAGGARALRRDDIGIIQVGRRADFTVLNADSHIHLAYRPGTPLVSTVIQGGQIIHRENNR
ncbi:imidazolonepropionase [Haloglycomyces albus]|uniref:imidazolonepropionase n=1 Tax=Haloglycomyces albus TaxID=526067 RepID=UPI00046D538A|nr:imidazolonepropionase [Haloglycomyces albus]